MLMKAIPRSEQRLSRPCRSRSPEVNNLAPVDCEEGRMNQITVSVRVLLVIVVLTNSFSWAKDSKKDPDEIGNRDVGKRGKFLFAGKGDRDGEANGSGSRASS